jgi:hypothetical protein
MQTASFGSGKIACGNIGNVLEQIQGAIDG